MPAAHVVGTLIEMESAPQARWIALVNDLRAEPAESPWIEFKSRDLNPEMIGKRISALANGARLADKHFGYFVWGIEDGTHRVVGTKFEPALQKRGNEPLEMWLAKMLDPSPSFQFHAIAHPDGRVVLAEIPAATHAPIKFDRIPYIRIGSATPPLTDYPERERALWAKLQPFAWETGIAAQFVTGDEVLERLDYPSYFELTGLPLPDNRDGIFDRLCSDHLITRDVGGRWNILNLGAILFSKRLDDFERLSRKMVRIVQYEGKDQIETKRRHDGQRGYASGFAGLVEFINGLLPGNEHIGQAFRKEKAVYPEIAIRELVANALIHQDMTIAGTGPIVEVFADRIEITNPGAPLIEPQRLIDMPPRSRNEDLASLMRRMGICEEQGSGINKVVTSVELFQLPPADFRVEGDNFKAVLFAPRTFANMTAAERIRAAYQHAVLRFLTGERLTNSSLGTRLGIASKNASMVSRIIKEAQSAKLIRPADLQRPRAGYVPFWA
jgi:predicted HTH transcriptional regulator